MTPVHETGRFPTLYCFLNFLAGCLLTLLTVALALIIWSHSPLFLDQFILNLIIGTLLSACLVLCGLSLYPRLTGYIVNQLAGRELIGDTTRGGSLYPDCYTITPAYTLPYAYNSFDRHGEATSDLYLSFSYAEIASTYQHLRQRRRVLCYLHTLSLPSYLGRRTPILTRKTAECILRDMAATDSASTQRVVLRYPFYYNCPSSVDPLEHEVFISQKCISELLAAFDASVSPEIAVSIGSGRSVLLTASYLRECSKRLATDGELIYIPLA